MKNNLTVYITQIALVAEETGFAKHIEIGDTITFFDEDSTTEVKAIVKSFYTSSKEGVCIEVNGDWNYILPEQIIVKD